MLKMYMDVYGGDITNLSVDEVILRVNELKKNHVSQ